MKLSQRLAYVVVLMGAVFWGTTGTAQTFMPQTVHPLVVGTTRLAVGGYVLLICMVLLRKIHWRRWPWKATIQAALAIAAFQYCFFSSIRLTGVAIGTVVAIGSSPVFSGVIEWVLLKRRPDRVWLFATSFAIVGCILLFSNQTGTLVHPGGVLFSLVAGCLFALYTFFSKNVLEKEQPVAAVAVIFSLSGTILLPSLLVFETEGLYSSPGLWTMLYLGVVTASLAYVLFSSGLQQIPSSSAVTLSLAEPLTAAILSVVIVGERLDVLSWSGVALLLGGILVLTLSNSEERAA